MIVPTSTPSVQIPPFPPPPHPSLYSPQDSEEDKDLHIAMDDACSEPGVLQSPFSVASSVMAFSKWLALLRRRSAHRSLGPNTHRWPKFEPISLSLDDTDGCLLESDVKSVDQPCENAQDISLYDRLGKAAVLDIDTNEISWHLLASLHRTENNSSTEQSEDELGKSVEVNVNSGGVVFFALFGKGSKDDITPNEAVAVIKFSSSRMATQSERLGYEFAKWLGVRTPKARVIHNSSSEWQHVKDAAEKAKARAMADGDEVGELTCSELLEALDLSRCLLLMNYVHGAPVLESSSAFDPPVAEKTAAAMGRTLLLDMVIRNEDRLPCRMLGWRGNASNLLFTEEPSCKDSSMFLEDLDYVPRRNRPPASLPRERRFLSADGRIKPPKPSIISQSSDTSDLKTSSLDGADIMRNRLDESRCDDSPVVAIDSGVPRRPPAGKRANDQAHYPKLVELLLNSFEFSGGLLYEISVGKMGFPSPEEGSAMSDLRMADSATVVHEFRGGFRESLRQLQGFHIFLLTLYQKLESHLRSYLSIINKSTPTDADKDESGPSEIVPHHVNASSSSLSSSFTKERDQSEQNADSVESESQKTTPKSSSSSSSRDGSHSSSPLARENWHGRHSRGSESQRSLRLTVKLRDFHKFAKMEAEVNRELEKWNENFKVEVVKFCQDNDFNSGFFEGSDSNYVVDAYELKVRLEHLIDRIVLINDAANTERPSLIAGNLFIGGALAARSVNTLQYLGITHILCLCSNEVGQEESQFPDLFQYKNFSICDTTDAEISLLFEEASDFVGRGEESGGKVLVHCFEGRSRSATVVLAYLMLRKRMTLQQAWNELKKVHHRAQPNDGFKKILLELDKKLIGRPSMEWPQRKPTMKMCPICGKNAGLSTSSVKLHLQKTHKNISSGSMDSAMVMEIQKAVEDVKIA